MVEKNGIAYHGVWELDGKFFALSNPCITDWHIKGGGAELYNDGGDGYVEVEYIEPPDPEPWRTKKRHTLREARDICRKLANRKETACVRLIRFNRNKNGVLSVYDIVETVAQAIVGRYPYGCGIDLHLKSWCADNALFCFEIVTHR